MSKKDNKRISSCFLTALLLLAVLVLLCVGVSSYRPDRPIKRIEPGSSSVPTFAAQIIRPRTGLPLGGVLPPELFGVDGQLTFDSTVPSASYRVNDGGIELSADGWVLRLAFDDVGHVAVETEVVFDLIFEDRVRTVRCRPDDPVEGHVEIIELLESGEISGHFDIQLPHCEDAKTGERLDWPPRPFVLRGSFDRLLLESFEE